MPEIDNKTTTLPLCVNKCARPPGQTRELMRTYACRRRRRTGEPYSHSGRDFVSGVGTRIVQCGAPIRNAAGFGTGKRPCQRGQASTTVSECSATLRGLGPLVVAATMSSMRTPYRPGT